MSARYIEGLKPLLGKADVSGFGDDVFQVRAISRAEAERIIKAGHYSKSTVWSSSVHLGVFVDNVCIGALQFGAAMNPGSGASIVEGTEADQWLELNRMWLADEKPENTASRAIAYALRYLRRTRPRVAWVQSFADERCGKLGAVYQAAGFVYCGSHETRFLYAGGEWFHQSLIGRAAKDKRGWGSGPKAARLRKVRDQAEQHVFRQYRYLRFLQPWARRRLLLPVFPYPKPEAA